MTTPTSTHREVEIKLDADPEFTLPGLTDLPGVTAAQDGELQQLSAFYVDSADLRLIRHGITFRRRTGGQDAGWHLKLPSGSNGRLEIHRPVGESIREVPDELLTLIRVQLRGEPVAPVAHIATHRTVHRLIGDDGVVLAEVADDLVTAESLGEQMTSTSWREIEVELVDGDERLLEAARTLLLEAGAREAQTGSKLQRALTDRLAGLAPQPPRTRPGQQKSLKALRKKAQDDPVGGAAIHYVLMQTVALMAQDPQVRLDADDSVHQMRVATRRLRATLATFRPLFGPGSTDPLRAELKWLGGVLGQARDAEVMRAHLQAAVAGLPAELVLGPVSRRIDLELSAAQQEAHDRVIEALDGDRYLALVGALETFAIEAPTTKRAHAPSRKELPRLVRHACRRVQQDVARLQESSPGPEHDLALHDVRKAAKRARYAAEAAQPLIGKPAKAVVKLMEAIQENLGDHQDAVVERVWLRDLGARAFLAGENGFTFGLLHGLTVARAQHDEDDFAALWTKAGRTLAAWPGR